jgi:hypothetical protein
MSIREQAIAAIVAQLQNLGAFSVVRNEAVPAEVGETGHVIIRDGSRLDAQATLGVHSWWISHHVVIEAQAGGDDPDTTLDLMLQAIDATLSADPTLGGVVLTCTLDLDDIDVVAGDGASAIKSVLLGAVLEYESGNALD